MNKFPYPLFLLYFVFAMFIPVYSVVNVRVEKDLIEHNINVEVCISETDSFQDTVSINKEVICIRFSDIIDKYTRNVQDSIDVRLIGLSGYCCYIDSISFPVESESLEISYKENLSNAGIAIGTKKILAKPHPNSPYNKKIKLSLVESDESTFINNTFFSGNDKLESVAKISINGEYINDRNFDDSLKSFRDEALLSLFAGETVGADDLSALKSKKSNLRKLTTALMNKSYIKESKQKAAFYSILLHCLPGTAFLVFVIPNILSSDGSFVCVFLPIVSALEAACLLGMPFSSMLFEKLIKKCDSEKNRIFDEKFLSVYGKLIETMNSDLSARLKEKKYKMYLKELSEVNKKTNEIKNERIIF